MRGPICQYAHQVPCIFSKYGLLTLWYKLHTLYISPLPPAEVLTAWSKSVLAKLRRCFGNKYFFHSQKMTCFGVVRRRSGSGHWSGSALCSGSFCHLRSDVHTHFHRDGSPQRKSKPNIKQSWEAQFFFFDPDYGHTLGFWQWRDFGKASVDFCTCTQFLQRSGKFKRKKRLRSNETVISFVKI